MDLNSYQKAAKTTAVYQGSGGILGFCYTALGLTGESGEYADKAKKVIRDGLRDPEAFAKELGDVLWYVAMCAHEIGYDLEDIALINLAKLQSRADRNKLSGSGDNR